MADLNPSKREAEARTDTGGPVVVLVQPQMGENIGMAARAMLNFGLTEMRLVNPRDGWPNAKAINASSGAHTVLKDAKIFDTTEQAVADLHRVAATTARMRDMYKEVQSPREWADTARTVIDEDQRCGLLFGKEQYGLDNDDMALVDTLVTVPTNPAFSSINLAQSVLLLGYEWRLAGGVEKPEGNRRKGWGAVPAKQGDVIAFYDHLEDELDKAGFLRVEEKRPRMVRNIRNIFNRIQLTDQEVRTLRGVIVALTEKKWRKKDGGEY